MNLEQEWASCCRSKPLPLHLGNPLPCGNARFNGGVEALRLSLRMAQAELIKNMRARIEQCRRLATGVSDERTTTALRGMAADIQADIKSLESEGAQ